MNERDQLGNQIVSQEVVKRAWIVIKEARVGLERLKKLADRDKERARRELEERWTPRTVRDFRKYVSGRFATDISDISKMQAGAMQLEPSQSDPTESIYRMTEKLNQYPFFQRNEQTSKKEETINSKIEQLHKALLRISEFVSTDPQKCLRPEIAISWVFFILFDDTRRTIAAVILVVLLVAGCWIPVSGFSPAWVGQGALVIAAIGIGISLLLRRIWPTVVASPFLTVFCVLSCLHPAGVQSVPPAASGPVKSEIPGPSQVTIKSATETQKIPVESSKVRTSRPRPEQRPKGDAGTMHNSGTFVGVGGPGGAGGPGGTAGPLGTGGTGGPAGAGGAGVVFSQQSGDGSQPNSSK